MRAVMNYFGMAAKEFSIEWKKMTPQDKIDLKTGCESGTLTY